MSVRPLDRLTSIKAKLGSAIVAAVVVTVAIVVVGSEAGISPLLLAAIAAAASLAVVQVLAHGMTSPLREMADAARAMARGDHGRTVRATSRDEVGDLARAFNAMAAELAAVERLRRDLVANVSHELRTPITALQALLENLVDGVQPVDAESLETALAQVERLGRLVAQLLDLSRLESGAVPLDVREFELAPLLDQAARESRLHRPEVDVEVTVEPPDLTAAGDPERIHQVVANLVANAVRYSPPGAPVHLSARSGRRPGGSGSGSGTGTVVLEVADSGPGIPDGEAERIFERFHRADASRSSAEGGAGLGLAIAKWIVDMHGGRITPHRRQPSGCRMVVELPRRTT